MAKYMLVAMLAGGLSIFGFAMTSSSVAAGSDCHRKEFKTELIRDACGNGGQAAAKKAMKLFLKDNVKPQNADATCKTCHKSLSPDYELKDNALGMFKKYGGKLL